MRNSILLPVAVLLGAAGTAFAQAPGSEGTAPPDVGTSVSLDQGSAAGPFCNTFWIDAEYLLWWTKANQLPPLLTLASPTDAQPGALGQPGTAVLFGGDVSNGLRSGGRVRAGYWFGDDHLFGLDASFFFLSSNTNTYTNSSSGNQILAVPFLDILNNKQSATILTFPNQVAASYTAAVRNSLWGADTDFRLALWRADWVQASLLAGFRYLQLNDSLDTATDLTSPASSQSQGQGAAIISDNSFATRNDFYGGQVGGNLAFFFRGFSLDLNAKLALGVTHESAVIDGSTQVSKPNGNPVTYPLGGLAQPTNIGSYSRDVFTVVPEGGLTLGYQLTRLLRATLGYTFLYTTHAVRPANLIDTGVNPTVAANALTGTAVVGPLRPTFLGTESTFWAQGASAGLEFRY